ncbi:MAG: hypothetical protein ACTHW7_12520, partial [Actinomycetaceae bacterium]
SFAPTADSPPFAPPSLADRQGSGARPATNRRPIGEKRPPADAAPPDPATARPTPRALRAAAARRAAKESDPHAPGRRLPEGPTARSALPRTAFHGLVGLAQAAETRPDLVPPADHPGSATIDLEPVHRADDSPLAITESGAPAPSRGPAVPTRPGGTAGPGGPTRPPGRAGSGRVSGRRRRRLQSLVAAFIGLLVLGGAGVLAVDRWRTSDDDSSLLGQSDDSPTMLVGRASQAPPLEDSEDLPAMAPGHGTSGGALSSDGYWDAAPGDGPGGSGPDGVTPGDTAPDEPAPDDAAPGDAPADAPGSGEEDQQPSDEPTQQPPGAGALPDSGVDSDSDADASSDSGASTLLPVVDLTLGACVPGTRVAAGSYGPGGQIRVMDCTTRGSMELVGRTRASVGQASATDSTVVGGAACRRLAADELGVSGADLDDVRSLVPSRDAHADGADEILCFMPPRGGASR